MKNLDISNLKNNGVRTVGLELENPLLKLNGNAISFNVIQEVWKSFVKNGWTPKPDPFLHNIIDGVCKDFNGTGASIISDSGAGNFELAIAPQCDLRETEKIYKLIFSEANKIIKKHKLLLVGFAVQPGNIKNFDDFRRRNAMYSAWSRMESSDEFAAVTSSAISAQQVGIGIELKEFVQTTNELIKITGLIVALCGNSPIHNWKALPYKEWRIICMDRFRFVGNKKGYEKLVGFPERPFSSIADFFKYYWDIPGMMLPLLKGDEWIAPNKKINFLQFFKSKSIFGYTLKGEKIKIIPDKSDINWASVQMWPHAKPHITLDLSKANLTDFVKNIDEDNLEKYLKNKLTNCYIECRAAGAAPVGEEMALPALMLGIVENLKELKKITKKYEWNDWRELVLDAAVNGIEARIKNESIVPLLRDLYKCAFDGLKKRGLGEEKYLDKILKRIKTRKNPADIALEKFKISRKVFLNRIAYN